MMETCQVAPLEVVTVNIFDEDMVCLSRKARIINFIKETWPTDKPAPKFRSNEANRRKLYEIVDKLSKDEKYTMPNSGLKYNAICELIRKHMMERRRKESDVLLSSMEETSDGSTSSGSLASETAEKVAAYNNQFKKGL